MIQLGSQPNILTAIQVTYQLKIQVGIPCVFPIIIPYRYPTKELIVVEVFRNTIGEPSVIPRDIPSRNPSGIFSFDPTKYAFHGTKQLPSYNPRNMPTEPSSGYQTGANSTIPNKPPNYVPADANITIRTKFPSAGQSDSLNDDPSDDPTCLPSTAPSMAPSYVRISTPTQIPSTQSIKYPISKH